MVLLVVMEWMATITDDPAQGYFWIFLQGEKFGATIFQGGNGCSLKIYLQAKMPAAAFVSVLALAPRAAHLDIQQTHIRGQFVEQKLTLSCSFRSDQIYNNHCYVFGNTLLCYSSQTWMFNKPTSDYYL